MDKELLFLIDESFERNHIKMSEEVIAKFGTYCDFLMAYNEKVNLTAAKNPQEVVDLHFVDSLAALKLPELKENALCADIGTGAGFPGVPLAITRPDLKIALVDSLMKRLVFLDELKEKIGLENVYTVHGRSEDLGHDKTMRGKFDCVFSRAVARLNVLAEYDLPFVKVGGTMLAWKGPAFTEEVAEAEKALKVLGGKIENIYTADVEDRKHFIVAIRKEKETPSRYPRQAGMPKKKPL